MVTFTLLAARVLEPSEFAAYMLAFGLVEAGRPLVSLGLIPVIQQYLPELSLHGTRADLLRFSRVSLAVRLALTAAFVSVCYLFWPAIHGWLGSAGVVTVPVALVCGVVAVALIADYAALVLEALMQHRIAQPLRTAIPVGKLVALIVFALLGQVSLYNLLVVEFVLACWCCILGLILARRALARLEPDGSRLPDWHAMVNFGWHLSAAQFLATAANPGVVRLAAARVLTVDFFAYFAFLQQLSLHVTRFMPSTQFSSVLRPVLVARYAAGRVDVVYAAFGFLLKINLMVGLGIALVAFVGSDPLAQVLYGAPIANGGLILACMMALPFFVAKENLASTILQIGKRSDLVRSLNVLALGVPVFVIVGGGFGGALGVVFALLLGVGLQAMVTLAVAVSSSPGLKIDASGILRILMAAMLVASAAGAVFVLTPDLNVRLSIALVASAAVMYVLALLLFRPMDSCERELVAATFPRADGIVSLFTRSGGH